jgi:hypothetical protein
MKDNPHRINVVCVKWGDKYGAEYVNRLKVMLDRNLTIPFKMWCYTEDAYGIDYDIEIIDIPEDEMLEGWWNKIGIFKESMPYDGRCLYLDLDTVIQNNIDDLVEYETHELCGVWTYWNEVWTDNTHPDPQQRHKVPFNSSVMTWNKHKCTHIWDHFWENHNDYIMKYYGDDKYLGNEIIGFETFPRDWIYSRLYGDGINKSNDKARVDEHTVHECHYHPDAKICLLNGPTEEYHYTRFKELWDD